MKLFQNQFLQTLRLLTIDWASATGGCREYSARRGSKDDTNVDLSCCASCSNQNVRFKNIYLHFLSEKGGKHENIEA